MKKIYFSAGSEMFKKIWKIARRSRGFAPIELWQTTTRTLEPMSMGVINDTLYIDEFRMIYERTSKKHPSYISN